MAIAAAAVSAMVLAIGVLTGCSGKSSGPEPTTVTTSGTPLAPIPVTPAQPTHNVGDDCSDGRIIAQWGLTADGQWVCLPKEQATSTESVMPPPTGEPGAR
ncbi:hypothetical protein ACWCW7_35330 [Nocardia tengchongensis]